MELRKVTVFIGNQGTGKSTVAKLWSTMIWLEKALVRGDFDARELTLYRRFRKHCEYQQLQGYFKDNTSIDYVGAAYTISYSQASLRVQPIQGTEYSFPKIMYVPAERNFVSAVDTPASLKKLPLTLYTFLDEFESAQQAMGRQLLALPFSNTSFEYRRASKTAWIVGADYEVKLSHASSGFQSFVPLLLVTRYLADSLDAPPSASIKQNSREEEAQLRQRVAAIMSNRKLSDEVKQVSLEYLSASLTYSRFVNIVEEPEQNLFPSSQKAALEELIQAANRKVGSELLLTTHSPYIINYLTLAVKAELVLKRLENSTCTNPTDLRQQVHAIVSEGASLPPAQLVIYELDEAGNIQQLSDYRGLPSDENYLNARLAESNDLFTKLIEIEDACQ